MSAHDVTYKVEAVSRCSTCAGEGRLNESGTPCPSCRGDGTVKRMVTLQEALAAVLIPPVRL